MARGSGAQPLDRIEVMAWLKPIEFTSATSRVATADHGAGDRRGGGGRRASGGSRRTGRRRRQYLLSPRRDRAAAIRAMYGGKLEAPLAVAVRDRLGELFAGP